MFNRTKDQRNQRAAVETVTYRENREIARVLLMGNSEIIIYRDEPGHLLFGLFNPVSRKPEN